jgi:hypothetical protein
VKVDVEASIFLPAITSAIVLASSPAEEDVADVGAGAGRFVGAGMDGTGFVGVAGVALGGGGGGSVDTACVGLGVTVGVGGSGVDVYVGVGGTGVLVGVWVAVGKGTGVAVGAKTRLVGVATPCTGVLLFAIVGVGVEMPPGLSHSGIPLWVKRMTAKAMVRNTKVAARIIATLRNWFLATTAPVGGWAGS